MKRGLFFVQHNCPSQWKWNKGFVSSPANTCGDKDGCREGNTAGLLSYGLSEDLGGCEQRKIKEKVVKWNFVKLWIFALSALISLRITTTMTSPQ